MNHDERTKEMSILLLRTTPADGVSARDYTDGGFQWPQEIGAIVTAPDWNPAPVCGGGLHGLLWGEGDGALLNWSRDALWWVVEAETYVAIDNQKAKAPSVVVRHIGNQQSATTYLAANGGSGEAIVGYHATAGAGGTATAGDYGTAIVGDGGTATAGDRGTATAGDYGTATAGYGGTATAGADGTATAGDRGTATAGYGGTATAGYGGTATAGADGTATAGDRGTLVLKWWDGSRSRYRLRVLYVGEDGIEPNTPYRLDEAGNPIKVTQP